MITQEQFTRISLALPILHQENAPLINEFQSKAFYARIPSGKDVFVEGDQVDTIALLISGVVRVYKIGETGREITLYRFRQGESCILTANAILSNKSFPAIATVEEDAEAIIIPAEVFRDWVKHYDLWREFVFELLSERLATIMAVVDEVVFQRMDRRVAAWLLKLNVQSDAIRITHQEIAADLGSSREVISRILEDFSKNGLISLGRGTLELIDIDGLETLAVM
ncbi:MAG: Crp/Fnr family transcriptional regulator [Anaerolineaceae bacterium]|nr:Crp/Fnr family transcriptional regulator [Anaerolineaceae bacterium]